MEINVLLIFICVYYVFVSLAKIATIWLYNKKVIGRRQTHIKKSKDLAKISKVNNAHNYKTQKRQHRPMPVLPTESLLINAAIKQFLRSP